MLIRNMSSNLPRQESIEFVNAPAVCFIRIRAWWIRQGWFGLTPLCETNRWPTSGTAKAWVGSQRGFTAAGIAVGQFSRTDFSSV